METRSRYLKSTRRIKTLGKMKSKLLTARRNSEFRKPKIRSTLEQGDCFYSSIYRACSEQKLLNKFEDYTDISSESSFVISMRQLVADRIKDDVKGLFETAAVMYLNSPDIYDGLPEFALELVKKYSADKSPNIDTYVEKYLNKVKQPKTFSGEIEVRSVVDFLEDIGIDLDIRYVNEEREDDPVVKTENKIFIVNEFEGHYEFISFKGNSKYPLSNYNSSYRHKGFQPRTRKRLSS
jgi:hypothetical protein